MNDSKHTPGPWKVLDYPSAQPPQKWIVKDAPGIHVRVALADGGTDENWDANARLIAAAPDAIHLLRTILEVWDEHKIIGPTVYADARALLEQLDA